MSVDEWKLLAEKLERERLKDHTPETRDVLQALTSVAWSMWADANTVSLK